PLSLPLLSLLPLSLLPLSLPLLSLLPLSPPLSARTTVLLPGRLCEMAFKAAEVGPKRGPPVALANIWTNANNTAMTSTTFARSHISDISPGGRRLAWRRAAHGLGRHMARLPGPRSACALPSDREPGPPPPGRRGQQIRTALLMHTSRS